MATPLSPSGYKVNLVKFHVHFFPHTQKSDLDVLMRQIKSRLLSDLNKECNKCVKNSVSFISKEKVDCPTHSNIHYYGEIQHWTSSEYSVEQLVQFLDSWRPLFVIEGSDINFVIIPSFNFTFNGTNMRTTMVNLNEDNDMGSGGGVITADMTTTMGCGVGVVLEEEIETNSLRRIKISIY